MKRLSAKNYFFFKYGLLVLNLFLMVISIRTYVNYSAILISIDSIKYQITQLEKEISFLEQIEKPLLNSPYALEFIAHETNKLLPWERFVQLLDQAPDQALSTGDQREDETDQSINGNIIYTSTQQARRSYLRNTWIQARY